MKCLYVYGTDNDFGNQLFMLSGDTAKSMIESMEAENFGRYLKEYEGYEVAFELSEFKEVDEHFLAFLEDELHISDSRNYGLYCM